MELSKAAAFGRLCVETITPQEVTTTSLMQPPSGGCVLKRLHKCGGVILFAAAAFGRLCVETSLKR